MRHLGLTISNRSIHGDLLSGAKQKGICLICKLLKRPISLPSDAGRAFRFLTKLERFVMSAIRHWDGLRIELDAAVVMPDHVHLIVRILNGLPLGAILKSIKGFSARAINRTLASRGSLWLDESFDHIIRHEQEWHEKVIYIRDNPTNKGIVENWQDYPWLWIKR